MCMRSGRPESALRTTGAPKSTALGADGAHSAGPTGVQPAVSTADVELPSAIPAFVERVREVGGGGEFGRRTAIVLPSSSTWLDAPLAGQRRFVIRPIR